MVVADVDADGGEETVQMIKEAGGEAALVHADVSSSSEVQGMIERAVELYGRLAPSIMRVWPAVSVA